MIGCWWPSPAAWMVARACARIKKAFDREGINTPYPSGHIARSPMDAAEGRLATLVTQRGRVVDEADVLVRDLPIGRVGPGRSCNPCLCGMFDWQLLLYIAWMAHSSVAPGGRVRRTLWRSSGSKANPSNTPKVVGRCWRRRALHWRILPNRLSAIPFRYILLGCSRPLPGLGKTASRLASGYPLTPTLSCIEC